MRMVVQVLNEKICSFIYCIGPCWIVDVPAGDWTNFSKTLIATHSVEEIITLQVALLSIVISPPARCWQLITSEFLLHTDNSPRKPCMSPLGFFPFDECASFMWMRRLNFAFQLFLLRRLNVRSYQHFYSRQSTGNTRLYRSSRWDKVNQSSLNIYVDSCLVDLKHLKHGSTDQS